MDEIRELLEWILDDATGDLNNHHKRVWAIRAELYRKIAETIDYQYNSERAMKSQERYLSTLHMRK